MDDLNPTLWRTCRAMANESRLRLLWRLFEMGGMSMGHLARSFGLSEPSASVHLRLLNSRGLIAAERRGLYVFYKAVPNPNIAHAVKLLDALEQCYRQAEPLPGVIKWATAFTHPRRIEIVRVLKDGGLEWVDLAAKTQIPLPSLHRHVRKLDMRGLVESPEGLVRLTVPDHPLAKALIEAALG